MCNLYPTNSLKNITIFLAFITLFGCSSTNKPGDIFYKKIYTESSGGTTPLYRQDGQFKGNDVYIKNRNSPIADEGIFALIVDPHTNVILQTLSYEEYTHDVYLIKQKNPSMRAKTPIDIPRYSKLVKEADSYNIGTSDIGMQSSLKSTYKCVPEYVTTQEVLNECTKSANYLIDRTKKSRKSIQDRLNNDELHLSRGQVSLLLRYPSSPCVVKDSMGGCVVKDGSTTVWTALIRNNTSKTVKDFSINCKIMASSGTVLSNQSSTVYDILQPKQEKTIKFQLYDVSQMKTTSCNVVKWIY